MYIGEGELRCWRRGGVSDFREKEVLKVFKKINSGRLERSDIEFIRNYGLMIQEIMV